MYAIIKLENQRHPTYILMNTLGMSQVQNTSFFKGGELSKKASQPRHHFAPKLQETFQFSPPQPFCFFY